MPAGTPRAGAPKASAAIWRWRAAEPAGAPVPRVHLRASLQALAGVAFGALCWALGSRGIATAAFTLAGVILLASLLSPAGLYAAIQRFFDASGRVIGRAMSWVVMVPIFYLFFLPFGILFRRGRRDRLHRRFEKGAPSYWEPHRPLPSSSLERQY